MNNMVQKRIKWPILNLIYLVISFLTVIIILATESREPYNWLFLLPLSFFCICFASVKLFKPVFHHIALTIIIGGYFIRMVITPLLFCLGNYQSFFPVYISPEIMLRAELFVSYECAVVLGFCQLYERRHTEKFVLVKIQKYDNTKISMVVMGLFLCLILFTFIVPQITIVHKPFFKATLSEATNIMWDNETIVARGGIHRIIYSLFLFIWPIVRILMPAVLISQILSKHGITWKTMMLSFVMLLTPFVFIGADSAGPIFAVMISMLVIVRVFGKRTYKLIFISAILLGVALAIIISTKISGWMAWRGGSGISVGGQMLNAYLPGFENTAIMLTIHNTKKWETLFFDLYNGIPFRETLFGLHGIWLQDLFTEAGKTDGQIIPFSTQIGHYVTNFIAPFFTAFIVRTALNSERKAQKASRYWPMFFYTTVFLITAASIHTYSFSIYFRGIIETFIPIYMLTRFTTLRFTKSNVQD